MSVRNSASNLARAGKDLAAEWEEVQQHWRDAKSREFAEEYLDELPDRITQAIAAMGEVESILKKVRDDCE